MENTKRQVRIESCVDYNLVLKLENFHINRTLKKAGQAITIDYEAAEALSYDDGFLQALNEGLVKFTDKQDAIDLGIEEDELVIFENDSQILKFWKLDSLSSFKEQVDKLPKGQLDRVIDYAVDNNIMEYEKTQYIKEKTGIDIVKRIQLQ